MGYDLSGDNLVPVPSPSACHTHSHTNALSLSLPTSYSRTTTAATSITHCTTSIPVPVRGRHGNAVLRPDTDVHADRLTAGTTLCATPCSTTGTRYYGAADEGAESRDLLAGGHKRVRESFVLLTEVLDFRLELREPGFFALTAF